MQKIQRVGAACAAQRAGCDGAAHSGWRECLGIDRVSGGNFCGASMNALAGGSRQVEGRGAVTRRCAAYDKSAAQIAVPGSLDNGEFQVWDRGGAPKDKQRRGDLLI